MPKGINKKLDKAKGLWVKPLHEVLWSYHATLTPPLEKPYFTLVYGEEDMLPFKFDMLPWRCSHFNEEENDTWLRCNTNLVDEAMDITHIREFSSK